MSAEMPTRCPHASTATGCIRNAASGLAPERQNELHVPAELCCSSPLLSPLCPVCFSYIRARRRHPSEAQTSPFAQGGGAGKQQLLRQTPSLGHLNAPAPYCGPGKEPARPYASCAAGCGCPFRILTLQELRTKEALASPAAPKEARPGPAQPGPERDAG